LSGWLLDKKAAAHNLIGSSL